MLVERTVIEAKPLSPEQMAALFSKLAVAPAHVVLDVGVIDNAPSSGDVLTDTATVVDREAASRMVMVTAVSAATFDAVSVIAAPETTWVTGKTMESDVNT